MRARAAHARQLDDAVGALEELLLLRPHLQMEWIEYMLWDAVVQADEDADRHAMAVGESDVGMRPPRVLGKMGTAGVAALLRIVDESVRRRT